ncbi:MULTISPECIES: hypothetical protein [Bacteroides]|uniref:hypothetical protein n=1 Tax=Bacteroides TaxID=816 RepID=UPI000E44499A|nr:MULTISPECIES: hypothetical protein [Bacteroides]MBS7573011.1 hypothetical protein [Bacteroides propionicigenes]RGM29208.1 hypothetical protein DXC20_05755 [Bacteroides sp. OM08-17BH]
MKIKKYISIMFLALTASYTFTACSDDDSLGEAPRLFRPVTSLEVKNNNLVATWENIKGATDYVLELYRVTGTDDQDNNTYELLSEVSCQTSPYTFEGLNWDEKYMVKIKCKGIGKESEQYQTLDANIAYISRLSGTKAIDNAVRISWKEASGSNADIIKAIKVVTETTAPDAATRAEGEDGSETTARIELVSEAELNAGYKDIFNLSPETKYTFYAYKDDEILDNSTYAGKLSTTTTTTPDFGELFPNGYVDLRNQPDVDPEVLFQDKEFWATITEGMGVILAGGTDYKIEKEFEFSNSISFMTGPTLGKNARIVLSAGMKGSGTIEKIQFSNIDFCGKKVITEGEDLGIDYIVTYNNTPKNLSGNQIFNPNGSNSTIKELIFKGCNIKGFRGVVRGQTSNDNFTKIVFEECMINGVGEQGVVTNADKGADWQEITFKDCTIYNICMLIDVRKTKNPPTINITNCTFCYAPVENEQDQKLPLFRTDKNEVNINISNTLFGPSMWTDNHKAGNIRTFTPGIKGSVFVDKASNTTFSVKSSYKTNFTWTDFAGKTYPLDGLLPLDFDEKSLWQDPENGDFKVIGVIGEDGIGASKWLQ